MMNVQFSIDPLKFPDMQRTKLLMKRLPDRVCSEHGQEIVISEGELLPNQNGGLPFAQAAFVGCCDAAIRKLSNAIITEALRLGIAIH